jgi:voltage-gated potassium channel
VTSQASPGPRHRARPGGVSNTVLNWLVLPATILAVYFLVPLREADAPVGVWAGSAVALLGLAAIFWVVLHEVVSAARRLRPAHLVLALELVLIIFSLVYYVLAVGDPGEFVGLHTRLDALYFSMVTVTTVGYGDVSAHGQVARALVTCQLAFNLVFVGALVGLFQSRLPGRSAGADGGDADAGGQA